MLHANRAYIASHEAVGVSLVSQLVETNEELPGFGTLSAENTVYTVMNIVRVVYLLPEAN